MESTIVSCLACPPCCGRAACRVRRSSAYSAFRSSNAEAIRRGAGRARHARLALRAENAVAAQRGRVRPGEALLAFGPARPGRRRAQSVAAGDLIEAAANLFSHLRALDAAGATIAVMPIPNEGLGEAINDRLAARRRRGSSI